VTGSRSDPETAMVTSEIVRPDSRPPIMVDWRLSTRDGLYKISDVIIDGVSMGASERFEFAPVIERSGGQVQGLFAMMREQTAALPSAPPEARPSGHG
jgi:phospholipid transport system substrate-binding protein